MQVYLLLMSRSKWMLLSGGAVSPKDDSGDLLCGGAFIFQHGSQGECVPLQQAVKGEREGEEGTLTS